MTISRSVIFGCQGLTLTKTEESFFERTNPLGFILFARNCESPDQVRELVAQLRRSVGRPDAPVLIDQEGGRVARLTKPHWREAPPAELFGKMVDEDPETAAWCAYANSWLIGKELSDLGIDVNCAPVADILHPVTHHIIGDRAFGQNPEVVSTLCMQAVRGFRDAGIIPVIKHLPGHGRAASDSHLQLPIVATTRAELAETDFLAFKRICEYFREQQPWGMTAHIKYTDIDPDLPATQSASLIASIIRGYIGFSGFLLSDCVTMKALQGSLGNRAKLAIEAGCDAALHCSGVLEEMIDVAALTPPLSEESQLRLTASRLELYRNPPTESVDVIRERLNREIAKFEYAG